MDDAGQAQVDRCGQEGRANSEADKVAFLSPDQLSQLRLVALPSLTLEMGSYRRYGNASRSAQHNQGSHK